MARSRRSRCIQLGMARALLCCLYLPMSLGCRAAPLRSPTICPTLCPLPVDGTGARPQRPSTRSLRRERGRTAFWQWAVSRPLPDCERRMNRAGTRAGKRRPVVWPHGPSADGRVPDQHRRGRPRRERRPDPGCPGRGRAGRGRSGRVPRAHGDRLSPRGPARPDRPSFPTTVPSSPGSPPTVAGAPR